jgi:hypothetical protein
LVPVGTYIMWNKYTVTTLQIPEHVLKNEIKPGVRHGSHLINKK